MIPTLETMLGDIAERAAEMSGTEVLQLLLDRELIDRNAAAALYVRRRVDHHVRQGMQRVRAMERVAEEMCRSYGTISKMIYTKN